MSVADTLAKSDIHRAWIQNLRTDEVIRFGFAALDKMLRRIDLQPGADVLDAGCGTGQNSIWLREKGFNVTGADFSEFALEQARRAHGIDFRLADLTDLPFADESFDAIFCIGVLMHVPQIERALQELVRVLRPGGWLVIAETNAVAPETFAFRAYWRVTGKIRAQRKPCGVEAWAQTEAGPLLSRKISSKWLARTLHARGLERNVRMTGELTEFYAYTSNELARKALHVLNRLWFRLSGPPSLAVSNYFSFRKQRDLLPRT